MLFKPEISAPRLPDTTPATKSNVTYLSVASGPEESETYPRVIARLNGKWRVIVCRNGIQWILQTRSGHRWQNRYFFRTREGLGYFAHKCAGEIRGDALVILLRLPERIGGASC
jgi:hypothetical protein